MVALKVPPQRGSLFENLGEFGPKGPELSLSTKSKKRSGFSVSAMAMLDMFVPHTLALGENLDAGFSFPFSTSTG